MGTEYYDMLERAQELNNRGFKAKATVRDKTGMIQMEVNRHGALTKLQLSPKVLDRLTVNEISATILSLAAEGALALESKINAEISNALGVELSATEVADGRADLLDTVRQVRAAHFGTGG